MTLGAIQQPDKALDSLMDPLKAGLEHEKLVTSLINAIYTQALEVRDYRTMQVLDWFPWRRRSWQNPGTGRRNRTRG